MRCGQRLSPMVQHAWMNERREDQQPMIIDFHTHIWRFTIDPAPGEHGEGSPQALVEAMDRVGVDKAVIVPKVYVASYAPVPILLDNEYMLGSVREHPERLIGFVEVNPRSPDAVDTVRQYLSAGLSGMKLIPISHSYMMSNHRLLDPLFEVCADFGVPVFVRANDDICTTPLQIEEMARTFPQIPAVVIGQMGRKWLMEEALMVARRTDNVYLETSDTNIEEIKVAVDEAGARKVLYASHWPPDEMEHHLDRHTHAGLTPADCALVLGENARRIFDARKK